MEVSGVLFHFSSICVAVIVNTYYLWLGIISYEPNLNTVMWLDISCAIIYLKSMEKKWQI
jgi:hypothetical protein